VNLTKKILVVATNINQYHDQDLKTGLWLGELTHFTDTVTAAGWTYDLVSPRGGEVPIDPESLAFFVKDRSIARHAADTAWMQSLTQTPSINDSQPEHYDAIYLTGGHGTMYDFVNSPSLSAKIAAFYEKTKIVAAVCHGVCGLLDVTLSDGSFLVRDKNVTGYSWFEERLARRQGAVPFSLEDRLKEKGARYAKGLLPLAPFVQRDGRLLTGQNPFSTKALAKLVLETLTTSAR
jgi:putative intracellular protease/amidase